MQTCPHCGIQLRPTHKVGDLVVDEDTVQARFKGERLPLAPLEFRLLACLTSYADRVWTRGELLDRVWGRDYFGTERTVDQTISQLRKKIGEDIFRTVPGYGYAVNTELLN